MLIETQLSLDSFLLINIIKSLSYESGSESHSLVSCSLRPHGPYSPWNSPGQNTGVGCLSLFQGIFPTQESNQGLDPCIAGGFFTNLTIRKLQNVKEPTNQKGRKRGKIEMSIWDLAGPLPKLIFIQLQRIEGFRTGSRACGWNEMDLKFLSLATCT